MKWDESSMTHFVEFIIASGTYKLQEELIIGSSLFKERNNWVFKKCEMVRYPGSRMCWATSTTISVLNWEISCQIPNIINMKVLKRFLSWHTKRDNSQRVSHYLPVLRQIYMAETSDLRIERLQVKDRTQNTTTQLQAFWQQRKDVFFPF